MSDQIKGEREDAIVTRVVERELTPEARARWARRLIEMAFVFGATGRPELADRRRGGGRRAGRRGARGDAAAVRAHARAARARDRVRGRAGPYSSIRGQPQAGWLGRRAAALADCAARDHRRPRHPGRSRHRRGRAHGRQRGALRSSGGGRRRAARLGQRRGRPRLSRSSPPRRHRERRRAGGRQPLRWRGHLGRAALAGEPGPGLRGGADGRAARAGRVPVRSQRRRRPRPSDARDGLGGRQSRRRRRGRRGQRGRGHRGQRRQDPRHRPRDARRDRLEQRRGSTAA